MPWPNVCYLPTGRTNEDAEFLSFSLSGNKAGTSRVWVRRITACSSIKCALC